MKDRFKLRVWDEEERKMIYYDPLGVSCDYQIIMGFHTDNKGKERVIEDHICTHKRYRVMFCTGRKDINNKLIYEGDILKDGSRIGTVTYIERLVWDTAGSPHPGFYIRQGEEIVTDIEGDQDGITSEISTCEMEWHNDLFDEGEIVGNIYENT